MLFFISKSARKDVGHETHEAREHVGDEACEAREHVRFEKINY